MKACFARAALSQQLFSDLASNAGASETLWQRPRINCVLLLQIRLSAWLRLTISTISSKYL